MTSQVYLILCISVTAALVASEMESSSTVPSNPPYTQAETAQHKL